MHVTKKQNKKVLNFALGKEISMAENCKVYVCESSLAWSDARVKLAFVIFLSFTPSLDHHFSFFFAWLFSVVASFSARFSSYNDVWWVQCDVLLL